MSGRCNRSTNTASNGFLTRENRLAGGELIPDILQDFDTEFGVLGWNDFLLAMPP